MYIKPMKCDRKSISVFNERNIQMTVKMFMTTQRFIRSASARIQGIAIRTTVENTSQTRDFKDEAKQISSLFGESIQITKQADEMIKERIFKIGELLTTVKAELPHGQFTSWVEDSDIPFSARNARNYMTVFENKDKLLADDSDVTTLTGFLKLLKDEDDSQPKRIAKVKTQENQDPEWTMTKTMVRVDGRVILQKSAVEEILESGHKPVLIGVESTTKRKLVEELASFDIKELKIIIAQIHQ